MKPIILWAIALALAVVPASRGESIAELPLLEDSAVETDWLVTPIKRKAAVYRTGGAAEIALDNGLIRRTFRLAPNAATVGLDNLTTGQSVLRGVKPEALVTINGLSYEVGGLKGQPNYAYLAPEWLDQMRADPRAMQLVGFEVGQPAERFPWKRVRHHSPDAVWPPQGVSLRFDYAPPDEQREIRVAVYYELYDGIPLMSKWITVHNPTEQSVTVDRFTSEILAVVEHTNWVEKREGVPLPRPRSLHVETDFAFGGFTSSNASRHVVHWRADPDYTSQVNYRRETPCLLVVEPTFGPAQDVKPGETFESYRTFTLVHDSTQRGRRALAVRRMYRTIAPWVTENPLMMHMRTANAQAVRGAIDQCAEVGFEMLILSFGSGFNIENKDPAYMAGWKEMADYARGKGVEIGGYSLLASRRIGGGNDVVSPEGQSPTFGNCPALTSQWGQDYFRKLYQFFETTGFLLLEHDGSYPGDLDVTPRPPLQKGGDDSRWVQWQVIRDFYRWCRAKGVYLNVPDFYYLSGSNKCGMGYREVNWSLPRAQQVIHTRQNIFDGTWTKTPSMGWMFVPLTQYHGGGAAATVEPLGEHLDHYERMIVGNLGAGVQACYRGPRLYDTEETRAMVAKWVQWYKRYRDILESDVVHESSRRADGRDLDWLLHANPGLPHKGLLMVYNPLDRPVKKTIKLSLYYTGLTEAAMIRCGEGPAQRYPLDREYRVSLPVEVPAASRAWFVIE